MKRLQEEEQEQEQEQVEVEVFCVECTLCKFFGGYAILSHPIPSYQVFGECPGGYLQQSCRLTDRY